MKKEVKSQLISNRLKGTMECKMDIVGSRNTGGGDHLIFSITKAVFGH